MEEKIEELEAIIQERTEKLIEAEKMAGLGSMVAGLTHEINTPLGISFTSASYMNEQADKIMAQFDSNQMKRSDLEKFLHTCKESSDLMLLNLKRVSDLVNSFKRISIDQSFEEKQLFNVKDYLDALLLTLQPKLKHTDQEVVIDCSENLEIFGYPGFFSQIITNLLLNSLKHGFKKEDTGKIQITIRKEHDTIYLEYKDNGKGIPKEDVNKVFQPFYTTGSDTGSTGLGMHIVRQIVEDRLGGSIFLESDLGKGVCFQVSFPIGQEIEEKSSE
ncbi:MAG: sensor histidine kinase [Spirochaetia bacterium]